MQLQITVLLLQILRKFSNKFRKLSHRWHACHMPSIQSHIWSPHQNSAWQKYLFKISLYLHIIKGINYLHKETWDGMEFMKKKKVWLGGSFESGFDTTCCCSWLLGLSFLKVADATIFINLSVCLLVENWNVLCTVLLLQMCPLPLPHSSFLRYYVNPISGLRFVW
jgi:hypothetical protein